MQKRKEQNKLALKTQQAVEDKLIEDDKRCRLAFTKGKRKY